MTENEISIKKFDKECPLAKLHNWRVLRGKKGFHDYYLTLGVPDAMVGDPPTRVSQAEDVISTVCSKCVYRGNGDVIGPSNKEAGRCYPEHDTELETAYPLVGADIR